MPAPAVINALNAVKRDTDLVGWFEEGCVLGLLRPDCELLQTSDAAEIEQQLRQQLDERLNPEVAETLSIGVHVPAVVASPDGQPANDALFEKLRRKRGNSAIKHWAKRLLDITGSLAFLIVCSPLLLLLALWVKLTSRGPVFFRQVRVGASGKPFTMLKFRTMHVDANHELHREYVTQFITGGSAALPSEGSGLFKIVNDPRVTFVGRLLRKTSLDELPQFLNVLRGDMSLVGPRPPLSYEVEQYKRWHYRRVLEAKPGITGLWQITGRSRTTFDDMVRLDLRYLQNQSAWTDIKIILATPRAVISGKGAC
jgi:exopolysaccharide biosynthesis polyprenyl glycosylphosphotransferase